MPVFVPAVPRKDASQGSYPISIGYEPFCRSDQSLSQALLKAYRWRISNSRRNMEQYRRHIALRFLATPANNTDNVIVTMSS